MQGKVTTRKERITYREMYDNLDDGKKSPLEILCAIFSTHNNFFNFIFLDIGDMFIKSDFLVLPDNFVYEHIINHNCRISIKLIQLMTVIEVVIQLFLNVLLWSLSNRGSLLLKFDNLITTVHNSLKGLCYEQ